MVPSCASPMTMTPDIKREVGIGRFYRQESCLDGTASGLGTSAEPLVQGIGGDVDSIGPDGGAPLG